jgi:hypothetical protein
MDSSMMLFIYETLSPVITMAGAIVFGLVVVIALCVVLIRVLS